MRDDKLAFVVISQWPNLLPRRDVRGRGMLNFLGAAAAALAVVGGATEEDYARRNLLTAAIASGRDTVHANGKSYRVMCTGPGQANAYRTLTSDDDTTSVVRSTPYVWFFKAAAPKCKEAYRYDQ